MSKKILAFCVALVALAVVPASAFATSPTLQTSAGVQVATGSAIKATNVGNTILTSGFGNITCSTSTLEGKLTENSAGKLKGEIEKASYTGTGPSGRCTSTIFGIASAQVTVENLPYQLQATTSDTFDITDASGLRFTFDLFNSSGTSVGSCTFERKAAEGGITGSYNTNSSPLLLKVTGGNTFTRVAGTTICPSTGTLDAEYKLQTGAGGELKIV